MSIGPCLIGDADEVTDDGTNTEMDTSNIVVEISEDNVGNFASASHDTSSIYISRELRPADLTTTHLWLNVTKPFTTPATSPATTPATTSVRRNRNKIKDSQKDKNAANSKDKNRDKGVKGIVGKIVL